MSDIPVIVLSNTKHYWLLRGLFYGFRAFWNNEPTIVFGYESLPQKYAPPNVRFVPLGSKNLPANMWTTGFIKMLRRLPSKYFILMLEDYWLYKPVRVDTVDMLREYMADNAKGMNILRIDLTADRAVRKQCRPYEDIHMQDSGDTVRIISSPPHAPYQMSYQAAIWNRDLLLEILVPNETAQESEVNGTKRLRGRDDILVLGTLERPLVYQPVYRAHRNRMQLNKIPTGQLNAMRKKGYLQR